MLDEKSISSHMLVNIKLSKTSYDALSDTTMYISILGSLQYAIITRPYSFFIFNNVCIFMADPLESHWLVSKFILSNLKGTILWGLHREPTPISISHIMPYVILIRTLTLMISGQPQAYVSFQVNVICILNTKYLLLLVITNIICILNTKYLIHKIS